MTGTADKNKPKSKRWLVGGLFSAAFAAVLVFGWLSRPPQTTPKAVDEVTATVPPSLISDETQDSSNQAFSAEPSTPEVTPVPSREGVEWIVFDGLNDGHRHLWQTAPGTAGSHLLTRGDWDDADPALSPDGERIAFRSNRNGSWDLFMLELASGEVVQLTQTEAYEGHPTWSPDGMWLAFEAYNESNLDIWILSLAGANSPIQLTNHMGLDADPDWDPAGGRRIAFISDRAGSLDVYLADLDRPTDRVSNLTRSPDWNETDPAFHPDGGSLAYATHALGIDMVWTVGLDTDELKPERTGVGRHPVWAPDGRALLAVLETPGSQQTILHALEGTQESVPIFQEGPRLHLSWNIATSEPPEIAIAASQEFEATETNANPGTGRMGLIALADVRAPNPSLVEVANEPFRALRAETEARVGWNFLGDLDHAFVALNEPLPPGYAYNDWLYTGRAVAIDQDTLWSGRAEVIREDHGGLTYWRLFVRTRAQDGSQGEPLPERPWDFRARYRGDPGDYDEGGRPMETIPSGYYVDFTSLAQRFGFERQPALTNWRSFLPGARFGEFAYTEGLDWLTAMLQLYPLEAVATPTPFSSPTPTPTNTPWPTPTPWWWRWRTPTPRPLPSQSTFP